MCVEEDLRPGMHSQGGTGYVIECISEKYLRNFTITYEIFSSSGVCVEANITYRTPTEIECPILSLSYLVREHSPPSNFIKNNLPPARAKPLVAPLPLYAILSVGHAKGRGKI